MFRAFLLLFMLMLYANQPAAALERSTPEAQGISSRAILGFVDAAEDSIDALHSFMLLRGGKVVAEGWWYPYNPDSPHRLYSLSKSFTSTAVGLAVEEGLMSLDDLVLDHFPEEAPDEPDENLAAMRVRDLLRMNTGHLKEQADAFWSTERDTWAESFLAVPVGLKPGTHFVYNTGATYMAGLMVQRLTGGTLIDYLTPRLFAPLGIEGATWQSDDEGYNVGGWGLKVRTEDIARFGQLLLQRGMWDGQRLLPEWWVAEATALQTANGSDPDSDWDQGYGYQFWRCRYNAYRGDGAFGQYCIVMPDQDAVVAITAGVSDMQQVLDLVWDHLLPAMEHEALPPADNGPLAERLRGLSLAPQEGLSASALADKYSGRRFLFAPNERNLRAVTFAFGEEETLVTVEDASGVEHPIRIGHGAWVEGSTSFTSDHSQPIAASGAWSADGTYNARLCFYETPFRPLLTFRFAEDRLLFDMEYNVGFGETKWEELTATAQVDEGVGR